MRKNIIAGNWKMNKASQEAKDLAFKIKKVSGDIKDIDVVLCPPYLSLNNVIDVVTGSTIKVGVQNMHFEDAGAYTGEVSADMIKAINADYVIIGHSERREYFGETDDIVNKKVIKALEKGLKPIVCVGETLKQREAGSTFEVIKNQIRQGLKNLNDFIKTGDEIIIAYEPIWAIGTGKVATKEQAQEVHAFIRKELAEIFNLEIADKIRIQYGGSVKPDNISELIKQPDIDGALVGGASLNADSFNAIIEKSRI